MFLYNDVVKKENLDKTFLCKHNDFDDLVEFIVDYDLNGELALIYDDIDKYIECNNSNEIDIIKQIFKPIDEYCIDKNVYKYNNIFELNTILELLGKPFVANVNIKELKQNKGIIYVWSESCDYSVHINLVCAVLDGYDKIF